VSAAKGDRVRLAYTSDPHTTLRPGALGTVRSVRTVDLGDGAETHIGVAWDDGSRLSLIPEAGDACEVLA